MIYNEGDSDYSCSCCTEDPSEEANAPEENENSTLYIAGGDNIFYSNTCKMKKQTSGTRYFTFTTSENRDISCGTLNYEWFSVDRTTQTYEAPAGESLVSFEQVAFEIAGDAQDSYIIETDPSFSTNF